MMDCAKHVHRKKIFGWGPGNEDYVIDYKATLKMSFYVRAKATQTQIQSVFDEVKFLTRTGQPSDETAFITDEMTQNELDEKLKAAGIDVLSKIKIANY